jgi:hypothetical protein
VFDLLDFTWPGKPRTGKVTELPARTSGFEKAPSGTELCGRPKPQPTKRPNTRLNNRSPALGFKNGGRDSFTAVEVFHNLAAENTYNGTNFNGATLWSLHHNSIPEWICCLRLG